LSSLKEVLLLERSEILDVAELLEVLNNAHVAALKNWRLGAVVKIEDKF
jgi:hypothetical protein